MKPIAIIGAGPAGIRAAQTLVAHGLYPVLLDEAARGGGQIYRRQPANFKRSPGKLYGFEAHKANAIHQTLDTLREQLDYRPDTLVWNAEAGLLDTLREGRADRLEYASVIVATGATDRVLPVPGWTLPGVYSLGAAQIALKFQGAPSVNGWCSPAAALAVSGGLSIRPGRRQRGRGARQFAL